MAEIDIKEIIATILSGTRELAENLLREYVTEAVADGKAFLLVTEGKIELWATELSLGNLSKAEFVSLVNGQKDLMELKALKHSGLLKIKLDEFRNGMVDLLTASVFKVIGL